MKRKLRMGMVGGGRGAFIGNVHRMAAQLDGRIELVCGCFSSDPVRSRASGRDWLVPAERSYASFTEMMQAELGRPADDRMDFVTIVTPNHLHFPVACAALDSGFHVVSDKPMTLDLVEGRALARKVEKTGRLFALTHNYTGYPMVKEARSLVLAGRLGTVRKVVVEYPQGWLAAPLEKTGQKQAAWRANPKLAGSSCCMGDIGSHAENLAEYITGLAMEELCADLTTLVKGRLLEDDGNVLVRFVGGARGVLYASQISVGEENALAIRVYGEKGGLEWRQEEPNTLWLKWPDRPAERLRAGGNHAYLSTAARANLRLPAGHPEGFIEAFANVYAGFADALEARLAGRRRVTTGRDFPTVHDGVRGMAFLDAVVRSRGRWVRLKT